MDFPANRFSGLIPSTFGAAVNSACPFLGFIGRFSPVSGVASAAAILIVTVALPGFMYLKKNKNKLPCERHNVDGDSMDAAPTSDPLLNGIAIYAFIKFFLNFCRDVLGLPQKLSFSYFLINLCERKKRQLGVLRSGDHTGFGEGENLPSCKH